MMAEFKEKITALESGLGPTIIRLVTGIKEKERVLALIDGSVEPTAEQAERIDVTYEIYSRVVKAEELETTRVFFLAGTDTIRGFESNLTLIREGHYDAVRGSADRLIYGGYS